MADKPAAVADLLAKVWEPAKASAAAERDALAAMALAHGETHPIEPWDWRYYAEKVRKARYGFDEAILKPYFSLERMLAAAFDTAHRLFGVSFVERPDINAYHPDVRVFEVRGRDDLPIGIFLSDNFARPTKRGGAWMSAYRMQSRVAGETLPIIVNNNNFAKAPPGEATLLSPDDVRTLFHEFGHGLHGLLSQVTYERLSGTQVLRDFVELPSQIFEHWAFEPAVLKRHAIHHVTGEPIPDELIDRMKQARRFNQGFETVEYTACALVDMALHAIDQHGGARHQRLRTRGTRAHRHAARDRAAPPAAALRSPVRGLELCRRLLRLHVGRGARRRRLRRVRRGRRPVRPRCCRTTAQVRLLVGRHARSRRGVPIVSRARPDVGPMLAKRGLVDDRQPA